jgi:antitoxin HicB
MKYLIDLTPDTDGSFLATCRAFPELTTFGKDKDEVSRNAIGALEEAIAARIADGDPLPPPTTQAEVKKHKGLVVNLPLMSSFKAHLYMVLQESDVSRAQLARRLGWHREQVDRLFRLDHSSRLDQLQAAFAALKRDLDVRLEAAPLTGGSPKPDAPALTINPEQPRTPGYDIGANTRQNKR